MTICIAAAQAPSVAGDVEANVRIHLKFIDAARAQGVELLVFPELSLSGYELPLLRGCALTPDNARLAPIREAAIATGMTVIVGAPLRTMVQPCPTSPPSPTDRTARPASTANNIYMPAKNDTSRPARSARIATR